MPLTIWLKQRAHRSPLWLFLSLTGRTSNTASSSIARKSFVHLIVHVCLERDTLATFAYKAVDAGHFIHLPGLTGARNIVDAVNPITAVNGGNATVRECNSSLWGQVLSDCSPPSLTRTEQDNFDLLYFGFPPTFS